MLKKTVATLVSLSLLALATSASASAYMKIVRGGKGGDLRGSASQKGHEGMIAIIGSSHDVVAPRDLATGQASGKRQYKPFIVTKEVDKSSPLLYSIISSNEVLQEITIQFYRTNAAGQEALAYTVKLTNASIGEIKFTQPEATKPETKSLPETEEISFTYQKIQWTWAEGNVMVADDWQAK